MLTVAQLPIENAETVAAHAANEVLPSDAEISRRVLRIRAGWSVEERVKRRREAEARFADLLYKLIESDIAA